MIETKQFVAIGMVLALLIGVTAVFLASGDPDGLESSALVVQDAKSLTGPSPEDGDAEAIGAGTFEYEAPMPDYSMGESGGKVGEIVAVVLGTVLALLIVFGVGRAVAASKH
ncbi:cobalt transport protein CbiN [Methanofollis liminatans DSM 4140]|uniref:Cobalt transport protein CbiN n=1 Tax=Methanofollis liminatans DSM 4140 TaxID=28892 RepID=J0SB00_9EURY|nr:PDGLE domain-containing protein [Methanofollis liminatans]EJG07864.1 cobalt transport protein CbiN [Methanofollis liminatans DSM 4140]